MLTVQSGSPCAELRPFIRTYVQREAKLGQTELVEPVVARLGVMLEFEFAGSYEEFAGEAPVSALHDIAPEHLIHFASDRSPGIT